MNDTNRKLLFSITSLLCAFCLARAAHAQALPDGPGKAEFVHNCLDCHSAGMVLRARKTPDEWRKNVDDMAARGSDGSKEDIDKVVLYLDRYFSSPPDPPPSVSSPPPAFDYGKLTAAIASLPRRTAVQAHPSGPKARSIKAWGNATGSGRQRS